MTLLLAFTATQAAVASQLGSAAPPVFLPDFVDPQHHLEKPDFSGIRVLRFLTSDDYPPFNFTAPDGSLTGFNVDLARALCDELAITCSIQARPFETLVGALNANLGDAIVASLVISPKTREQVAFTAPVIKTPAWFTARSASTPGPVLPETVGKQRVGVQAGTAHEAYLRAFFPTATLRTYTDPDSLRTGLKSGDIDLMFADGLATALWLNSPDGAGCCAFAGGPFTESRYFGEGSGIAVRKGERALRDGLDYALGRLSAKGILGDLYLKYFPIGFF